MAARWSAETIMRSRVKDVSATGAQALMIDDGLPGSGHMRGRHWRFAYRYRVKTMPIDIIENK